MFDLTKAFVELIRLTSTDLSPDVEATLTRSRDQESQQLDLIDGFDYNSRRQ